MTQTTAAVATAEESQSVNRYKIHRAWSVAAVTFVTIIGAAAFRSLPGLLIDPLNQEFAW